MCQEQSSIPMGALLSLSHDDCNRPRLMRACGHIPALDQKIDARVIGKLSLQQRLAIGAIHAYRALRPRAIGDACMFEPSCSRFTEIAIEYEGVLRGARRGWNRILRCKDTSGGVDIPDAFLHKLEGNHHGGI